MRAPAALALWLALQAAAAAEPDAWATIGPAAVGQPFAQIDAGIPMRCDQGAPVQRCTGAAALFAGVPVQRVEAAFRAGRLASVTVRLDASHYPALLEALSARLGEPEDRSFRARAGMAGDFQAGVKLWAAGEVAIVLEQYAGKIDRAALSYGDAESMAALLARMRAHEPGAWRDL